jgi:DNA-binding HxlR family transcriptional regulator
MEEKIAPKSYQCSFEFTMDVISGKWKGLVLWHLSQGTLRYGELKKRIDGITQKMLTQTLRELERCSIVHREVYRVVPPKVEYSLTSYGLLLVPLLEQLHQWGEETYRALGLDQLSSVRAGEVISADREA